MLLLFTPDPGSPKFHSQAIIVTVDEPVVRSVNETGLPSQCPAYIKLACGPLVTNIVLVSESVHPKLLVTVRVTAYVPVCP